MVFKKGTFSTDSIKRSFAKATAGKACLTLLCLFFFLPATKVLSQTKDTSDKVTVNIIHIDNLIFNKTDSGEYNRLLGGVILQQGTDTLYCDSAYQNTSTKNFEAFSNVKIAQQDGTQGKSDYLKYTSAQKLAYMRGNVSLTDGKNNLKTEELTYDLGAKIGNYYNGGTLYNDSTTVTSTTGVYNAHTKDSHFTGHVVITDPEYKIKSEDLVYNTETKLTQFFAKSIVTRDSGRSILETKNGTYNGKYGIAHFIGHSSIWNDDDYIEGDSLDYNKLRGHGIANGHVICIDTAHHSRLFCGHAEYFHKKRVLWAEIKPVLEQVNGKDTFYMRSDTMYSAPMVKAKAAVKKPRKVIVEDTVEHAKSKAFADDREGQNSKSPDDSGLHPGMTSYTGTNAQSKKPNSKIEDTVIRIVRPIAGPNPDIVYDTAGVKDTSKIKKHGGIKADSLKAADSLKIKARKAGPVINWVVPSGPKYRMLDTLNDMVKDTASAPPKPVVKNKKGKKGISAAHIAVPDTSSADTTAPMYFVGWNHVLLFSDSMQGKCDSICYTRSDSLIRMIKNPIDWAHNSQITGDTILLQLDSNEIRNMYVPNNALVVSQSGPPKAELFDQVQGKTLTAYFKHNAITNMIVVPDAECIYYSKDEHNAYMGVNQAKSVEMLIYFEDQKITNIKFEDDVHQTVTPLEKADLPNTKLSRFKWLIDERPKTKEELFK